MPSKIIPSLRYEDCPRAIEWLGAAFGFTPHLVVPGENGRILHAQMICDGQMVMLGSAHDGDEFGRSQSSPLELEGRNTASIYMIVSDADAHYAIATGQGAEVVLDLKDEAYGGRGYTCKDFEGHLWNFGTYDPWSAS